MSKRINCLHFIEIYLSLLKSGMNENQAMECFAIQKETEHIWKLYADYFNKSFSFSDAFYKTLQSMKKTHIKEYKSYFYLSEKTGSLKTVLSFIKEELKETSDNKKEFFIVMLYPVFIILLSVFLSLALIFYGLPIISSFPGISVAHIKSSIIYSNFLVIFLLGLFLLVSSYFLHKNDFQKKYFRTMNFLCSSGIDVQEALEICFQMSFKRRKDKECVLKLLSDVRKGRSFYESSVGINRFDLYTLSWIQAGMQTGQIKEILEKSYIHYSEKNKEVAKVVMRILEPAIILITGIYLFSLIMNCVLPVLTSIGGFL